MANNSVRVKLNTWLLPLSVILLIGLQLFVPYQGWMILLVGLGGAWLVALMWVRSLARNLMLVREMRFGWAQVGDRLEERFTLINESNFPALWIEVLDHSTLPGYNPSQVTGVGGQSEHSWRVHGVCAQRGAYILGPTTLRTGDPFGLYTLTLDSPATKKMMVLPPVVPLPEIRVAPGGRAGEGRIRRGTFEQTVSVSGVRDYVPGDSVRWIHWRTSARRDELYVRLFENLPRGDWWVLLDLNTSIQVGQGQNSTIEHGIILAASLSDYGLRSNRAVGLAANAQEFVWLPPQGGPGQRWQVLRELALARPGANALANVLAQTGPMFRQLSSLIIITPDTSGEWIKSLMPILRRGIVPTILLFDPASFGGIGDPRAVVATLQKWDVARYVITRDLLDRPEAQPGHAGEFDFHITPHGRAVLAHPQGDSTWKVLS